MWVRWLRRRTLCLMAAWVSSARPAFTEPFSMHRSTHTSLAAPRRPCSSLHRQGERVKGMPEYQGWQHTHTPVQHEAVARSAAVSISWPAADKVRVLLAVGKLFECVRAEGWGEVDEARQALDQPEGGRHVQGLNAEVRHRVHVQREWL